MMQNNSETPQSIESTQSSPTTRNHNTTITSSAGVRCIANPRNIKQLLQRKKRCSTAPSDGISEPTAGNFIAAERSQNAKEVDQDSDGSMVTDDETKDSIQPFSTESTSTSHTNDNNTLPTTEVFRSQRDNNYDLSSQTPTIMFEPSQEDQDDSSDNSEEDFENDTREKDTSRRIKRHPVSNTGKPLPSLSKMDRPQDNEQNSEISGNTQDASDEDSCEISDIQEMAKKHTALCRGVQPTKSRTTWSKNDTNLLVMGIEKYGCSWSSISAFVEGWEKKRDQVALKDKARNLKVSLLKAGIELPSNFDKVPLGKKEIASVRVVIPDYEQ